MSRDSTRPVFTVEVVCDAPGHDHVKVWNRGGLAGTLTVMGGDGIIVAERLTAQMCADRIAAITLLRTMAKAILEPRRVNCDNLANECEALASELESKIGGKTP